MLLAVLGIAVGLIAIAGLALIVGRSRFGSALIYGITGLACAAILCAALTRLFWGAEAETAILPLGLPWVGARFRLDSLAAFFLAVVHFGGAVASLYAIGYGRHEKERVRVLPFYPVFLAAMTLVVLADDAFGFLASWEFMSLSSWALVAAHHREDGNRRAGLIYLIMAGFGTLCLLLAFGFLAGSGGGYSFDAIRALPHEGSMALVLVLALLGAGSKAGLVPLHVWLPLAHPAAPSHVSALMSGVMTKVAVYGFIRIVMDLVGAPTWWAGMIVLTLGAITAVTGVLYALMQNDMKRLLAYSTVENIGVVFIGLGLAMAFQANGAVHGAALSITAALFHVFNHSVFKSLMFFGAGAVLTSTGQRDLDRLGGLIHKMPVTAFAVLTGCAAISALPPLNGFVSEWMTFQAILLGPDLPQWGLKFTVPAAAALLALSAALAAACFVKLFGVAFLGRPRSKAAEGATEIDRFSLSAMLFLAAVCFLAGILPGFVIDGLRPVANAVVGSHMPSQSGIAWLSIVPIEASRSSYNGMIFLAFVAISSSIAAFVIHHFASRASRRAPAWDCGFPDAGPATQYSASSFAQPIRRIYGASLFGAKETVDMPLPGDNRPAGLDVEIRDRVWDWLYAPVAKAVMFVAEKANRLQFLTIRRYLSLVFLALIILLLALAIWP